ncbi:hypothetical protein GPECTOR_11g15 [Gonium pectorale]|uniref:Glucosidase 2 subunit beta n=1 Tax=Gonium pectorale TaxID=33097 RepID=A0A150GQS2_GONPE|nr:hypothetical protein GPECTOR_11g15 [Gonium pectorale]|eukprot:KXZ51700.1 hypothetical protein GPECTOR_11g15 [Gonium pectorale]
MMLPLLLVAGLLSAGHGQSIRGLNPDLTPHYSGSGGTFTCISGGGKVIPFSRVNDDYCDCPDGSDEPGTSACHNGRFYCRNLGHEPRLLASAFVDDGVCDCCDGADELKGKCQNTCLQASAVHKEALKDKIAQYEQTLAKKAEFISSARAFKEDLQRKEGTIEADIAAKQQEVAGLKEEVARLEAEESARRAEEEQQRAEQAAAEQAEAERAAAEQAAAEQAQAEGGSGAAEQPELSTGTEGGEARELQEEQAQTEERESVKSEQQADEPAETEEHHYDEHVPAGDYDRGVDMSDEDFQAQQQEYQPPRPDGHAAAAGRPRGSPSEPTSEWEDFMLFYEVVKQWARTWIHLLSKVWKEGIRDAVLAHREKLQQQMAAKFQRDAEEVEAMRAAAVAALQAEMVPPARQDDAAAQPEAAATVPLRKPPRQRARSSDTATDSSTPLGTVRNRLYDAERALEQLQKDKQDIQTFLHIYTDFGPGDVFLSLANKCFTSYQTRWNYEVCPFKQAVQREGYSNSVTVGRWYGFSTDHKIMYFTGGDECAGVGPRTMTVHMECGHENKLSDGEEPATCQYSTKFATPALCGEEQLEDLRKQLHNLEAFEKEVQALIAKDEL